VYLLLPSCHDTVHCIENRFKFNFFFTLFFRGTKARANVRERERESESESEREREREGGAKVSGQCRFLRGQRGHNTSGIVTLGL